MAITNLRQLREKGLAGMVTKKGECWNCSNALEGPDYGRQEICSNCRRDTRVCKNCEFYDTNYNNECKENQADRIVEKEKSNFCDYFSPRSGHGGSGPSRDDLKNAAESLFKK